MKTYYLTHKGSKEKINSTSANKLDEAIVFFAICKKLTNSELLRIFEVHEEK